MPKFFLIFIVLILGFTDSYCQCLTLSEMLNISKLSHDQANQYLTTEKHFTLLSSIAVYSQKISQFKKETAGTYQLIVKSQWKDRDRIFPSVHYDIKPSSNVDAIISELDQLGFKLISKEDDSRKHVRLYDNGSFTLIIYTFNEKKLPASVEIHGK
jgi:hypothetical protein